MKTKPVYFKFLESLPWRFFRKLAFMQIIVTTLVILATAFLGRYFLKTYLVDQSKEHLQESLLIIQKSLLSQHINPVRWCRQIPHLNESRYNIIGWDGEVLCDSSVNDFDTLENHATRPEIVEAKANGQGSSVRFSKTLQSPLIYAARVINIPGETNKNFILRQSIPLDKINQAINQLDRSILYILMPLLLAASLISLYFSLQLSFPLKSLLSKVSHMKNLSNSDRQYYLRESDEWTVIEKAMERAQSDLESRLNQLHQENEKISALMSSISDSILAVGQSRYVLFANKHFKYNFLGSKIKNEKLIKMKLWEVTRNLELQELFEKSLSESIKVKKKNMTFVLSSGKRSYFDLTITPLRDFQGTPFGAVGVFHDVTDRRLSEQMREDFVANVSHEVRTPLTSMKGYVQLIKTCDPSDKETVHKYIQIVEENSDRLTHLFNDILNLSVIESKNEILKEQVSTKDITGSVLANVRQVYGTKNIDIETSFANENVLADPFLLEQVLTNLIDNAFKYTLPGGKVYIGWTTTTKGKSCLEISDTGIGIPSDHLGRLFERFYRVDPSRSRELGGTGLGLSIVKHIVQRHDGKIFVESTINKGTTFRVVL